MLFRSILGNIIKYVLRHRAKNGVEDLMKAQDYLSHLINLEVGKLERVVPSSHSQSSRGLGRFGGYIPLDISSGDFGDAVHVQDKEE